MTDSQITAIKLFDEIASQLYFAVGHGQMVPALSSLPAQQRFLSEYSALISKLTTLGTPNTVHRLLEVLSNFVEVDPERSFDLISEALLRTTGIAKYEHESLGAALFVTLVGRFLADHRSIFDDVDRRRKLIDCFAIFVEAGWPQARRLFHTLPELLG